ncbi:TraP protein, partial [Pseudomonas syringae pv. theae]
VQAIQNGMAWVYWQDKTWAVSPGEKLGQVTVTGINPQAREVLTSAGTIK